MRWLSLITIAACTGGGAIESLGSAPPPSRSEDAGASSAGGKGREPSPPVSVADAAIEGTCGGSPGICGVAASLSAGTVLTTRDATGTGVCATTTAGDIIDAARALVPDLPDVREPFDPGQPSAGEAPRVLVYRTPCGGFAAVFITGNGDCPAGCIDHRYWYFETNPSSPKVCTLGTAGAHARTFDRARNCYEVKGSPRWGQPTQLPRESRCDVDRLSGTYTRCVSGGYTPCGGNTGVIDAIITLAIEQDASDASKATLTLGGTRYPGLDGVPYEAHVNGRVITAEKKATTGSASCLTTSSFTFELDLDKPPGFAGYLEYKESKCTPGAGTCEGGLGITLAPDTLTP